MTLAVAGLGWLLFAIAVLVLVALLSKSTDRRKSHMSAEWMAKQSARPMAKVINIVTGRHVA